MEQENMSLEEKSGKSNNMAWVIVVLVALIGGGFWYYQSKNMTPSTNSTLASGEPAMVEETSLPQTNIDTPELSSPEGMTEEVGVKTFTLEAGSFYYKPNVINVKKGDKVKVVLNAVDMMHNFNIDELKVKSDTVKSGESTTVEFTADKVGSFEFYCAIGSHRAKGQIGTLTVTE